MFKNIDGHNLKSCEKNLKKKIKDHFLVTRNHFKLNHQDLQTFVQKWSTLTSKNKTFL